MTYYIVSRLIGLFVVGCIVGYHIYRGDWKQQGDPYKLLLLMFPILFLVPKVEHFILTFVVISGSSMSLTYFFIWLNSKIEALSEKQREK